MKISEDAPISRLGLPMELWVDLRLGHGASFDPPKTLGDLLPLVRDGRPYEINRIGPGRFRRVQRRLQELGYSMYDTSPTSPSPSMKEGDSK
jgi:hypothetical protein